MAIIPPILKATRWGALGILKFIIKHWYLIIFLIIVTPLMITSVKTAIATSNPSYPFIQIGLHLANADAMIDKDVNTLKENPQELIGMEKPTKGIWKTFVYYWKSFLVFWRFLGNIWLITFPFVLFYKGFKFTGIRGKESSKVENIKSALIWGLIFIFIINLLLVINGLVTGELESAINQDTTIYERIWTIILSTLPFHGLYNLITYLFTMS